MAPIFKTAGQAVHFAYIIQAYSVLPACSTAAAVQSAMREVGLAGNHRRSTVDFGGLTLQETHDQCAHIRQAVRESLPDIEIQALEAKFSQNYVIRDAAIRAITKHMADMVDAKANDALLALVCRHYQIAALRSSDWTVRGIGEQFGISKDRAQRVAKALEKHITEIEQRAIDKLSEHFESSEWIEKAVSQEK